jgi:hypothetical protein
MSLAQSIKLRKKLSSDCVIRNTHDILGFLPNGAPRLIKVWRCGCGMNVSSIPQNIKLPNGSTFYNDNETSDEDDIIGPCKCCVAKIYKKKGIIDTKNTACKMCLNYDVTSIF